MPNSIKLTIEYLNSICSGKKFTVLSRTKDPNICVIKFKECGHETEKRITSFVKNNTECKVCYEEKLRKELYDAGYLLLSKISRGEKKSSYEERLCSCLHCGTFKFITKSRLHYEIKCKYCEYLETKEIARRKGYSLINRADKNGVLISCMNCGHVFYYQVSNLRRVASPPCPNCNNFKKTDKSYVYGFKVIAEDGFTGIKIGKSNNPFLRHLRFSENCTLSVSFKFIGNLLFRSEADAYEYEKFLHERFAENRIDSDIVKRYLTNGFTEVYHVCIESDLEEHLKYDKRLTHQ